MVGVPQYASPEELAHARAVEFAREEGGAVYGYTGTQFGNYTADERRAAAGMTSMYYNRPVAGVRFQGGIKGRGRKSPRRALLARKSPSIRAKKMSNL